MFFLKSKPLCPGQVKVRSRSGRLFHEYVLCCQFETPVYGSNEPTFTEFMAPGVILSITYFMAVGLTSISFIIERKEGLLDRYKCRFKTRLGVDKVP